MTHLTDKSLFDQDGPVEQEVGEVYRDLPPLEPSAELDARIRAAVAQELVEANIEGNVGEEKPHSCIVLPWWRRPGIPMALAASLLIIVGLGGGWFFTDRFAHQSDSGSFQLAQAPAPDAVPAPAAADLPEQQAKEAAPALDSLQASRHEPLRELSPPLPASPPVEGKPARAIATGKLDAAHDHVPDVEEPLSGIPAASSPPPAKASSLADASGEPLSEAPDHDGAGTMKENSINLASRADDRRLKRSAAPSQPSSVSPDLRVGASQPSLNAARPDSMDSTTLAKLRELLEAGRRDEARNLLKTWREKHPDVSVPEELLPLLRELEAEKPPVAPAQ